jgi:O-antigen/teichoic acid export membrane protein
MRTPDDIPVSCSIEPAHTVVKNSLWMVVQPLALNLISLFVVGYTARLLGDDQYGRFILGFTIVAMIAPFANFGLRAITVREVAARPGESRAFIDMVFSARLILSLMSALVATVSALLSGYPFDTKLVVCLASLTIVFQAMSTTFYDVFQAQEKMREVALAQAVTGLAVIAFTVGALLVGYRLLGVTMAYVLANATGLAVAWFRFARQHDVPRFVVDVPGFKSAAVQGAPFFLPGLVAIVGSKVGILILSSISGDAAVGHYGAANGLVERLGVVPDGICTAFYPTMVALYQRSAEEGGRLFKRFFFYMVLLGLPIGVGTTVLAEPIIRLVYGPEYIAATFVLQILIWSLFITFLTSLQSWALGAIHQEKLAGVVTVVSTVLTVVFSLLLIPRYAEHGAAMAALLANATAFALLWFAVRRHLVEHPSNAWQVGRAIGATAVMGAVCFLLRDLNIALVMALSAGTYAAALWAVRVVSAEEIRVLRGALLGRAAGSG